MPSPRKRSPSPAVAMSNDAVRHFLAPRAVRMSYRIGRSEQGVLTFEPYKGHLLPMWRFKTPDIARDSSARIEQEFLKFEAAGDFVGCDMARKFLQMGMTRSTRYANRAGGRKYDATSGDLLPKSTDHPGRADKLESAGIFREAWERVKAREAYADLRRAWEREKKEWDKAGRPGVEEEEELKEPKAEAEDQEDRVAEQRKGGKDGAVEVEADVTTASGQTQRVRSSTRRVKEEHDDEDEPAEVEEAQKPKRKRRKVDSKVKEED